MTDETKTEEKGQVEFITQWAEQLGVQDNPFCIAAEIIQPKYDNFRTAAALISGKDWVHDADWLKDFCEHVKGIYVTLKDTPRHAEDGSDLWANYIYETWLPWYKSNVQEF